MSRFRELRERAHKRCTLVARVVAEVISDRDLHITVARTPKSSDSSTVTLRIALSCEFHVPDDTSETALRKLAPLAYRKLAVYARTHFFDHIGTDPNQKAGV